MDFEFKQTRHYVARGARPDVETGREYILIKASMSLHATYQVRLLAFMAQRDGRKLRIMRPGSKLEPDLRDLKRELGNLIKIERKA